MLPSSPGPTPSATPSSSPLRSAAPRLRWALGLFVVSVLCFCGATSAPSGWAALNRLPALARPASRLRFMSSATGLHRNMPQPHPRPPTAPTSGTGFETNPKTAPAIAPDTTPSQNPARGHERSPDHGSASFLTLQSGGLDRATSSSQPGAPTTGQEARTDLHANPKGADPPKPFDAHCHVHLQPSDAGIAVLGQGAVSGAALQSTRPLDWDDCAAVARALEAGGEGVRVVRGYGVHPWYAHQVAVPEAPPAPTPDAAPAPSAPWLTALAQRLVADPTAFVGEIGLDGPWVPPAEEWYPNPDSNRPRYPNPDPAPPRDRPGPASTFPDPQRPVFRAQLALAAAYGRAVSVHAVQCWGALQEDLRAQAAAPAGLPPAVYLHAFGGKAGVVPSLLAIERQYNAGVARERPAADRGAAPGPTRFWFGFAQCINCRSPKTPDVIRAVGLERLLLESDREGAGPVPAELAGMAEIMAQSLNVSVGQVLAQTARNAALCYGLQPPGA